MIPIPAIDLKSGRVVRLLHGKFDAETVYGEDAAAVAKRFAAEGAARIHVVDLDGALHGEPKNIAAVEGIIHATQVPIEIGGGIRTIKMAKQYLEMGARWVVLGTKACLDKGFLAEAVTELGDKAIIGIDAKDGFVAVDGWTRVLKDKAVDLVKTVQDAGGRTVIYTDISKDGALSGPNFEQLKTVAETVKLDVIASGGVSSLEDVKKLRAMKKDNIIGVIIGKAIYEKKVALKEAIAACS